MAERRFALIGHTHVASAEINDLSVIVTWANVPEANIPTHTGDVTGGTALTAAASMISGKTLVTAVATDMVLLWDATDSSLKRADVGDFAGSTVLDGATSGQILIWDQGNTQWEPVATSGILINPDIPPTNPLGRISASGFATSDVRKSFLHLNIGASGGTMWCSNENGGTPSGFYSRSTFNTSPLVHDWGFWNPSNQTGALSIFRMTSDQEFIFDLSCFFKERAAALSSVTARGQFWVRNDTPNTPMFTDDAGTDFDLTSGGAEINDLTAAVTWANIPEANVPTHTGDVTGGTNLSLVVAAITTQTALTSGLAGTDELVLSDAGVIKRMDISVMNAYFNSNLNFLGLSGKAADSELLDGIDSTGFPRLGNTSPPLNFLYHARNSSSTAFYVRQAGSGPIIRVFKNVNTADTGATSPRFEIDNAGKPSVTGLAVPFWNTSGQTSGAMTISTSAASGGANGDIHYRY